MTDINGTDNPGYLQTGASTKGRQQCLPFVKRRLRSLRRAHDLNSQGFRVCPRDRGQWSRPRYRNCWELMCPHPLWNP